MYPLVDYSFTIRTWLEQVGAFDFFLPFILIFAVLYTITSRLKPFSENKAVPAIISLVIAILAMGSPYISQLLMPFFSNVALGLCVLVGVMILLGLFSKLESNQPTRWILGLMIFGIVLWLLSRLPIFYEGGTYTAIYEFLKSHVAFISFLVGFIIVIIVIILSASPKTQKTGNAVKKFLEGMFKEGE